MNIGYARVSTQGQTLENQLEELGKADCSKIYSEKISGAKCDRPELQRLLKALEPGSVVVVTRLDRLVECALDGGQLASWELTGAAGLSEDESHGQAPHP